MLEELVRRLHAIVDERIAVNRPATAALEAERGTVDEVISSLRLAMVRLGGSDTPVPVTYPALPVTLVAGDEVVIQRRRDGWLMVSDVLDRDPPAAEVTAADLEALAVVPAGTISAYGGASAPSGWLLCDGSAVSRTTYADLFTALGTTFGTGDGSTTFNVPDLRGRFPLGVAAAGTGSTLGGSGGSLDHVHSGPSHTHASGSIVTATQNTTDSNDQWDDVPRTGASSVSRPVHDHTVSGSTAADGTADTGSANPPYLAVSYIIRT